MEEEVVESIKNNEYVPLRKNEEKYKEPIVETMQEIEEND